MSKDVRLLKELGIILNILKEHDLDPWHYSVDLNKISGEAVYNGDTFQFQLIGNAFSITVKPLDDMRQTVAYTAGLSLPKEVNVHYDLDDLSSDVIAVLKEKGSIIIHPEEVIYSGVGYFRPDNFFHRDPFFSLFYTLQKPNEKHLACNVPIDSQQFDPNTFPYHDKEEDNEHNCIVNKPFPFIPTDDVTKIINGGFGLSLHLKFYDMERKKLEEILVGTRLPIRTSTYYYKPDYSREDGYYMFFSMHDRDRPSPRDEHVAFKLINHALTLEEGVPKHLNLSLKYYLDFAQ